LPLAWFQTFDGSREVYLALGHRKEDYDNPILYNLIRRSLLWSIHKK
jgi:type 1 glutamine amidotransferase